MQPLHHFLLSVPAQQVTSASFQWVVAAVLSLQPTVMDISSQSFLQHVKIQVLQHSVAMFSLLCPFHLLIPHSDDLNSNHFPTESPKTDLSTKDISA